MKGFCFWLCVYYERGEGRLMKKVVGVFVVVIFVLGGFGRRGGGEGGRD